MKSFGATTASKQNFYYIVYDIIKFCSFHHVKREGNKLAHSLARRAVLSANMDVWVEEIPEDLNAVFQGDLAL